MARKVVYVSGMFRSGTTLLGKCLGSHPQIALALDPMLEIFREVRNKTLPKDKSFDTESPFHHNFWDDMTWKKSTFMNSDFKKITLSEQELDNLIKRIIRKSETYSPALCKKINDIKAKNIFELFEKCFNAIDETYGEGKKIEYVGFKEVWGEEFAPALLNNFPEAKVVHIIRDPRAVTSSKLAQKDHYPFLFLARFWRKSVTQSILWSKIYNEFKDRYYVVRYEDLIRFPEKTLKDICKFLGLEFSDKMLDYNLPDKNADYAEGANSSYSSMLNKKGFLTEGIDRWTKELTDDQKSLIEWLTYPEIQYYDYINYEVPQIPSVLADPPEIDKEKIAGWLKPYEMKFLTDKNYQKTEYAKEMIRHIIYELSKGENNKDFSDDLIDRCYYDKRYLNHLKGQISK